MVYGILPSKCTSAYDVLFSETKKLLGDQGGPTHILIDFEQAAIQSIRKYFPDTEIGGCWFHLSQNIFRKAQELGLQTRFQKDCKFRNKINSISALAFVPIRDVKKRFKELVASFPEELYPLAEYFESTYIGSTIRDPTFDIEIWNLNGRVKQDIPRTSNFIEGWHNRFQTFLKTTKPQMWRFLLALLLEQHRTENRLENWSCTGILKLQLKKYRENDKRIKKRIKMYSKALKCEGFHKWIKSMSFYVPNQKKF